MKLKPQCVVVKGSKSCQLARMPGSAVCWFHMNNSVLFPRDRGAAVPRSPMRQFKALLLERQGNVCAICGYRFYGDVGIDVDHLWPWIAGGKNNIENCGAVHSTCNRKAKKALRLHDPEIREKLKEITKHWTREEAATARVLSNEEEEEVCRRYEAGEISTTLDKEFGVSFATIIGVLRRNDVKVRSRSEANVLRMSCTKSREKMRLAHGGLTDEQEKEVCLRYEAGEKPSELGKIFGCKAGLIRIVLERRGAKRKSIPEAHGGLSPEQEAEAIQSYQAGKSQREVAIDFGVSSGTISNMLQRKGVECRSVSQGSRLFHKKNRCPIRTSQEKEDEICRRYLDGESARELGRCFDCTGGTIGLVLKRNGVQARPLSEATRMGKAKARRNSK